MGVVSAADRTRTQTGLSLRATTMPLVPEDTPPTTSDAPKRAAGSPASEASTGKPAPMAQLKKAGKVYGLVSDILSPQRVGLLIAVAVLLGFGWLGGWNEAVAETDELPVVKAGEAHPATPFEITVKKAFHAARVDPILPTVDGRRYLLVTADVVNTSDRPVLVSTLTDDLTLDAHGLATSPSQSGPVAHHPLAYRINDALGARAFSPGVTVPVVFAWEQDATVDVPAHVTVTVPAHAWRASTMDGDLGWRDPTPAFRVTLDVVALPEA